MQKKLIMDLQNRKKNNKKIKEERFSCFFRIEKKYI